MTTLTTPTGIIRGEDAPAEIAGEAGRSDPTSARASPAAPFLGLDPLVSPEPVPNDQAPAERSLRAGLLPRLSTRLTVGVLTEQLYYTELLRGVSRMLICRLFPDARVRQAVWRATMELRFCTSSDNRRC